MARKSKITPDLIWRTNFLYHHTKLSITAIGRRFQVSFGTANKMIVGKQEWEKMNEAKISEKNPLIT